MPNQKNSWDLFDAEGRHVLTIFLTGLSNGRGLPHIDVVSQLDDAAGEVLTCTDQLGYSACGWVNLVNDLRQLP